MSDTLSTTLADIKAAEQAERAAARDAYALLVEEVATDTMTVTAGQVVNILRRASRTTEELAADVRREKERLELVPVAGQFEDAAAKLKEATAALEEANQEWARAKVEIDKPVLLAALKQQEARDALEACREARSRLNHLKAEQQVVETKRGTKQQAPAGVA